MAGDDGTATPSQAPTTISPTHIEETIFKIVEVTDAPSYAPGPGTSSGACGLAELTWYRSESGRWRDRLQLIV